MLLEQSFYSFNTQAYANIPTFDAWIEAQDHTPGYQYLKLLLKFLQWQQKRSGQSGQRWALKSPHHLHYMDLVFKVFPDAQLVLSHRDPLETIPSLTSLIAGNCDRHTTIPWRNLASPRLAWRSSSGIIETKLF